jgi:hypothetical protein
LKVVSHVQAYGLEGMGTTACGKQGSGFSAWYVHTLGLKAAIPSKGFFHLETLETLHTKYCTLYFIIILIIFFSSAGQK